ncbi:MAG: rod shape-determining protein MreC [Longimicrobiales bacterium]
MLDFDGSRKWRRREFAIAAGFTVLAALLRISPSAYQEPIRSAIRSTVLRPFVAAQGRIAANRARSGDISLIRAQRDSLAALAIAQTSLSEENRRLRAMLGLGSRAGTRFIPAQVLRVGLAGTEGRFLIDVGTADGVASGSPVVAPEGLVGVIVNADEKTAEAIDWSHGDFRVSAMTADGQAYGIVEASRRGSPEEYALRLTGAPFHSDIRPGTAIVTSGRGQLYPRGIPIGTVLGIEEADTGWRKSYLIRPAVRPEAARQVLVGRVGESGTDVADVWQVTVPPDTATAPEPGSPASSSARTPTGNGPR